MTKHAMNHFLNEKSQAVAEAIDGAIYAAGGKLTRLDGFPNIRVVVRSDWDRSRVALVSGGGSGHEPSHIGFVGKGMLTAAICGDIFASPSVDAILSGILAVTGPKGCLLIVKNYTGDRLNFGLAAERAKSLGLKLDMVVVDDDVALPDIAQPRGLAGTLFVHKIAGALAEAQTDLAHITAAANAVIRRCRTIGMSLGTCNVPGVHAQDRIPTGKAEIGLGIHGEPGIEQIDFQSARAAMSAVVSKLGAGASGARYVALLNNLGATSVLEMAVLANELSISTVAKDVRYLVGPSALTTSLDMHGFSLTLLALEDGDIELLLRPVDVSAWPGCNKLDASKLLAMPTRTEVPPAPPSANKEVRATLTAICEELVSGELALNQLDAKSGDGDTGSTLATAASSLLRRIDELPLRDMGPLFHAVSRHLEQVMGGSSGVLLAILLAAASKSAEAGKPAREALAEGMKQMQAIGGAKLGDRTLVDALHPALDALQNGLSAAAQAARAGAAKTATMTKAGAGRASYVGADQLAGHVDPGAEAVARVFERLANR